MKFVFGNMWQAYYTADLFVFTGNGYVTKAGKLAMGRGFAYQVKLNIPEVDTYFGAAIRDGGFPIINRGFVYHFLVESAASKPQLGVFQVKRHWSDAADLGLIEESCRKLRLWADQNPGKRIEMNYPGIGNGRLSHIQVEPILKKELGDVPKLRIWEYKE